MKEIKFEIAPREQLLFLEKLEEIFLDKILGHPEALVTDESLIFDFCTFDIEHSIGKGKKAGTNIFKYYKRIPKKDLFGNLEKGFIKKDIFIESKAIHYRKWIIRKCKRFFNVDITDYYDKYLPELLKFIMQNLSKEKALELGLVKIKK